MPAKESLNFRKLTDTQKSAVCLHVNVRDKLMLRRSAKMFRRAALHHFMLRTRFGSFDIDGPDEMDMPGVDSEFQMTSQGDDDGLLLSLVKPGEHITLDLTASSVVDQHSQLTRRYHDKWTVTKEIDSAEAVCEFLNRLLIALPPHAVHFHCGPMTGQTALFYREHLDVMRSPMRVTHFQTSVDVLVPRLSDERRLSRQPYEIALSFGDRWSPPEVDPNYGAVFEQIAHLPKISLRFDYFCDNFWALAMEVVVPMLEAALVTHRPTEGETRIISIGIKCRLDGDIKPGYRPIDIIETLGTKIGINDRIEIYRCTTESKKCRGLPRGQRVDEVDIYLGQNCGANNAAWRMETEHSISEQPQKRIKEWPIAEAPANLTPYYHLPLYFCQAVVTAVFQSSHK